MIVSVAEEMNASRRPTMEDCHVFRPAQSWNCGHQDLTYLGVYDGHGGRDIVEFLEQNLCSNIAQELCRNDYNITNDNNDSHDGDQKEANSTILERMECGFLLTDIQSYQAGIHTSGATAVVCLIKQHHSKNNKKNKAVTIYSANCGDARAVLSTSSTVIRLTHDHRANDPIEQKRIESSGGFVIRNRVLGILAVARSFGDHGLKEYVICRPDLRAFDIRGEDLNDDASFVILACDGLWDVMEDEEAVDLVKRYIKGANHLGEKEDRQRRHNVARMLADEALKRASGDNITVLVAWLSDSTNS